MNLCSCCFDEASGTWCGCEEKHPQDGSVMAEARDYVSGPHELQLAEQWSYYCSACSRYTSGNVYYIDN